jgi:hypothetical protein
MPARPPFPIPLGYSQERSRDVGRVVLLGTKVCAGVVALFVLLFPLLLLLYSQPGGSGVLASLRLPDGSEYMVTQKWNSIGEPYSVAFYMRSKDGPWGWCYIDHEAIRWANVSMSYDPASDVITVTKRGIWQAALDRKGNSFAIGDGQPRRTVPAPQEQWPPPYPFPTTSP